MGANRAASRAPRRRRLDDRQMTPARCMVTTVAQQAVDAWRAVLAYGIERRELARNVAAAMKKVPRVHQEMSTYTPDEIRRVLRAADRDLRNGHLWYLALSGLRRAEIAGLRSRDTEGSSGVDLTKTESHPGRSEMVSDGAPGRIRTCGLLLRRQTLYPLSYGGAQTHIAPSGPDRLAHQGGCSANAMDSGRGHPRQ